MTARVADDVGVAHDAVPRRRATPSAAECSIHASTSSAAEPDAAGQRELDRRERFVGSGGARDARAGRRRVRRDRRRAARPRGVRRARPRAHARRSPPTAAASPSQWRTTRRGQRGAAARASARASSVTCSTREIVEQRRRRHASDRPGARAPRRGRVDAPRSERGITSRRNHTRRWRSSSFIGSCTGTETESQRRFPGSRRGASRAAGARTIPRRGAMPARPAVPLPRSKLSNTVSAWSSRGVADEDRDRALFVAGRVRALRNARRAPRLRGWHDRRPRPSRRESVHRTGPRPRRPHRRRSVRSPAARGRHTRQRRRTALPARARGAPSVSGPPLHPTTTRAPGATPGTLDHGSSPRADEAKQFRRVAQVQAVHDAAQARVETAPIRAERARPHRSRCPRSQ